MNLWRTQRPRFPVYEPDGHGRDYYIKFNNAGYWGPDQIHVSKKDDYERAKYNNFHTLYHQAAPFRYYADGHGRETYILSQDGFFHPQKPLCNSELNSFLRNNTENYHIKKNIKYKSVAEKKFNNQLQSFEKQLLKRLYKDKYKNDKKNTKTENYQREKYSELSENIPLNTFISSFPILNKNFNKNYFDKKSQSLKTIKPKLLKTEDNYDSLLKQSQKIQKYQLSCFMDEDKNYNKGIEIEELNKNSFPGILRKNISCKAYLLSKNSNLKK